MARGGVRPGSGRKPKSKNRKTLERENAALAEKLRTRAVTKTDLAVMLEIRDFWMGVAANEQRTAAASGRTLNMVLMGQALEYAGAMAAKRAPFLHAKLSSVTVREDPLDLTRLTDAELVTLARIRDRARADVGRGDTARAGATAH